MTDYEHEIEVKLFTMRDLAKTSNSMQAAEALLKLVSSYTKSVISDILEQYGVSVPLNATKPVLVNALVRMIVTEAVLDKTWQRWLLRTLGGIYGD